MNDELQRYIETMVEPTFEDFARERSSRRAFLCCVAIFHAVDRAPGNPRQRWNSDSLDFRLVDMVAHHFKHVLSGPERGPEPKNAIPLHKALGFNDRGDEIELHHIYFIMRDAIVFLRAMAAEG